MIVPFLNLDETVIVEVRKEVSKPLSPVFTVRCVVHMNPMAKCVQFHLVVFTEESNYAPAELSSVSFETWLCGYVCGLASSDSSLR